jgi:hypothetical protein
MACYRDSSILLLLLLLLLLFNSCFFLWSIGHLWNFFSFSILYTVRRTPWTGDEPVARPLPMQIHMPQVRFKPTIPVFERAKTVHDLDRAATVIGCSFVGTKIIIVQFCCGFYVCVSCCNISKPSVQLSGNCVCCRKLNFTLYITT